ncbi:MAG: hypothetical protein R3222_09265 [Balneolaceae bacterium]|nr:hypothetical protein [Balneolaceae bacterium]
MITLYRKKEDPKADRIQEKLDDLVVAYDVKRMKDAQEAYIREDDQELKQENEIKEWLNDLRDDLEWQRSLTADACYIDPETGENC